VLETGHGQHFAREAFAEFGVASDMVVHDLDDHLTAEVGLAREVNASHTALAEQPNLRQRMGQAARASVAPFSSERVADEYASLCRELLASTRS
jgi:hypothetical protein